MTAQQPGARAAPPLPPALADSLEERITDFFGQGRCFLLAKGRVGLYAGLKALDLPQKSSVLMPGYTCMVVPSAVQFAGLTPVYVNIDPATYNIDPRKLEAVSAENVSALIVQHTYGIPCEMPPLAAWAAARGVPVIEDSCHAFGSKYAGRLCGGFGKFAFMSGQWNKPFSTGLGGILLVNDAELADRVAAIIDREAFTPGRLRNAILSAQILAHKLLVRPATAIAVMFLYRALNRLGLAIGSSSQEELAGKMPERYLTKMAPCQVRRGLREMAAIEDNIQHRIALTAFYQRELPRLGFTPLASAAGGGLPLLRYPVRVANKKEVLSRRQSPRRDRFLVRGSLASRRNADGNVWLSRGNVPRGRSRQPRGDQPAHPPQSQPGRRRAHPRFPAKTGDAAIMLKRLLDILISAFGLLLLSPLAVVIAAGVKLTSPGPVLFRHERVGRGFRPFKVLKFRTMVQDAPQRGGPITCGGDPRVTRLGRFLRRTKLDEMPQLVNVLRGDMSLVGPRPEVRRYVEMFRDDYEIILRMRPGITDLASIKYRDEEAILERADDPDQQYLSVVLPEKIRLAKQYVANQSLRLDLTILLGTAFSLACDRLSRPSKRRQARQGS